MYCTLPTTCSIASQIYTEQADLTSDAAAGTTIQVPDIAGQRASASPGDNKGSSPTDDHHGGQHSIATERHHERRTFARPLP
ncbi:hypothetical protein O988_00847, partial [Pseudogymnoascus sp. VKM F-3808]